MPRQQQSQNMANISKPYILTPRGAWDVSEVWGSNRWTYSPSLLLIINYWQTLNFALCKRDGITDRQTYRQTNGLTDGQIDGQTITRCPRRTFHYICVPITTTTTILFCRLVKISLVQLKISLFNRKPTTWSNFSICTFCSKIIFML